jgi:hypothetical protein
MKIAYFAKVGETVKVLRGVYPIDSRTEVIPEGSLKYRALHEVVLGRITGLTFSGQPEISERLDVTIEIKDVGDICVPYQCTSPAVCRTCGQSVFGLKLCTEGQDEYYCDVKCQGMDWDRHQHECNNDALAWDPIRRRTHRRLAGLKQWGENTKKVWLLWSRKPPADNREYMAWYFDNGEAAKSSWTRLPDGAWIETHDLYSEAF